MIRRLMVSVGVIAAVAGLATACSGKSFDATPTPTSNPSPANPSSSASQFPYAGAPKVVSPLADSALSGDPCATALTPKQADALVGSPIQVKRDDLPALGPGCRWSNLERQSQLQVGFVTVPRVGLSGTYQNIKPQSGVWKPLADVQGFPAVAHAGNPGQTPQDYCIVTVGLADDLAIDVAVTLGRAKIGTLDPCEATLQAADAAVSTLKARAGS